MDNYSEIYKKELLNNVIPFWLDNSKDDVNGGYFTCLDREGKVFDTDKFMWLQGREVWMFATLYNKLEQKQEWLDMALHGANFMKKYGRDAEGNWYFSLNQKGEPLVHAYNIFSDCFAAMAFGALYEATKEQKYAEIAKSTFENILKRKNNSKGHYNKIYPGTRDLKSFSLPMILSNLSIELAPVLDKSLIDQLIKDSIHEVMDVFYHEESGLILENVNLDGSFSDSFEGRLVNPGHTIEAMWFMMDLGKRINDEALIKRSIDIAINALEFGWDKRDEGIFYFLDLKGAPTQQLEWDQKLWWVHIESLICMAKGWKLTGDERCKYWFDKLHDYTWNHFKDEEHPEWFGYLNRKGEVLLNLKGGKWKGCFHVPRGLFQIFNTLK